ncbi:DUF2752 domain-containing protein [Maribacter sp. 2308TA10-17]|uniref:DUF2752 domain-containing protein n=1 Tax=Maribacter sp. 2308TA10-17 TaxID=3386276 RepID=UPI0039BD33D1
MKIVALLLVLSIEDYMLPCFTKKIFGVDCPGCGLQRGAAFLAEGDFVSAWNMYPALFTIIPLFGVLAADQLFRIKYANKIIITLMISSVVLILTNYILKFI